MQKGIRLIKRMVALSLVLLLSIESFAAVVSDNDGSAFITKAEFDSLKNDFQSQIDEYNTSLDSKIDGAIASYLSGIRIAKTSTVNTYLDSMNEYRFYHKANKLNYTLPENRRIEWLVRAIGANAPHGSVSLYTNKRLWGTWIFGWDFSHKRDGNPNIINPNTNYFYEVQWKELGGNSYLYLTKKNSYTLIQSLGAFAASTAPNQQFFWEEGQVKTVSAWTQDLTIFTSPGIKPWSFSETLWDSSSTTLAASGIQWNLYSKQWNSDDISEYIYFVNNQLPNYEVSEQIYTCRESDLFNLDTSEIKTFVSTYGLGFDFWWRSYFQDNSKEYGLRGYAQNASSIVVDNTWYKTSNILWGSEKYGKIKYYLPKFVKIDPRNFINIYSTEKTQREINPSDGAPLIMITDEKLSNIKLDFKIECRKVSDDSVVNAIPYYVLFNNGSFGNISSSSLVGLSDSDTFCCLRNDSGSNTWTITLPTKFVENLKIDDLIYLRAYTDTTNNENYYMAIECSNCQITKEG